MMARCIHCRWRSAEEKAASTKAVIQHDIDKGKPS